jgi:spermidine/putrescine transport system ATP-binding protein
MGSGSGNKEPMVEAPAWTVRAAQTPPQPAVELCNVVKMFDGQTIVHNISLAISPGEFFSILGPSGCGKTTTLRLVAGFEQPSSGEVILQGRSMGGIPPYRRPVNTVFQSYALFGHMSVWDNVAFGLRVQGLSRYEIRTRVHQALVLVKLEHLGDRHPQQLSGGQQQRVALARALVNRPSVLLLDEPLAALDLKLRREMQFELASLHRQLGLTFIMVTHDQQEALSLSDRIAVMNQGHFEQVGTPQEIYDRPASAFVADFIGDTNLLRGRVQQRQGNTLQVETEMGLSVWVTGQESPIATGAEVVVSVRPEKLGLSLEPASGSANCFAGQLSQVQFLGDRLCCLVELKTGDQLLVRQSGAQLQVPLDASSVFVHWDAASGLALTI